MIKHTYLKNVKFVAINGTLQCEAPQEMTGKKLESIKIRYVDQLETLVELSLNQLKEQNECISLEKLNLATAYNVLIYNKQYFAPALNDDIYSFYAGFYLLDLDESPKLKSLTINTGFLKYLNECI